jgi:membrane-associated phospholipid phosphatase
LGDKEFYLLFLPLIYWCVDRRTGVRLLFLLLVSVFINSAAKVLVHQPRPFHYDSRVEQIVEAYGGGLPSGHTQNTMVLWWCCGDAWHIDSEINGFGFSLGF